jgi:hypothetical protein
MFGANKSKERKHKRSTLHEGVATLVLVKIQLFSNVNLETNISFKSCHRNTCCAHGIQLLCHTGFY